MEDEKIFNALLWAIDHNVGIERNYVNGIYTIQTRMYGKVYFHGVQLFARMGNYRINLTKEQDAIVHDRMTKAYNYREQQQQKQENELAEKLIDTANT